LEVIETNVLVIGSGAGGAVVAATLAEAGFEVVIAEEGPDVQDSVERANSPESIHRQYRNGGLTPIMGNPRIAYMEGRCVGGSTEINSGFWHRTPASVLASWQVKYGLVTDNLLKFSGIFEELEQELKPVRIDGGSLPASSRLFLRGLEALDWPADETPRLQTGETHISQFHPGVKRSMSATYLPRAIKAGATLMVECQVSKILRSGDTVTGVEALVRREGEAKRIEIRSDYVWACGGAVQTPTLLRRSGIRKNVGDNLQIHPMLKVVAEFEEDLNAHQSVMPVYQIRDAGSDVFIGGSAFTPGLMAMALGEAGNDVGIVETTWRQSAMYYASVKSQARGRVRTLLGGRTPIPRFNLNGTDETNLTVGLLRLVEVLFHGGAKRIFPGIVGQAPWSSLSEAKKDLTSPLDANRMLLSTVHMTSTCPMGENLDITAADSFGKVHGLNNLYLADASAVPDAPGVNPQGTVMALALINAKNFVLSKG
jgi:choline dehydrogenase-like flavoprotein